MPFFPAPPPPGLTAAVSKELQGETILWAARPRRSALARPLWHALLEGAFFISVFALLAVLVVWSGRDKNYHDLAFYVVAFYVMAVIKPLIIVIKQWLPGQSRYLDRYRVAARRSAVLENFFFAALAYTLVVGASSRKLGDHALIAFAACFFLAASVRPLAMLLRLWRADQAYYMVTERRAIIFENYYWRPHVRSFEPGSIRGCERVFRRGTQGDLLFQPTTERLPVDARDSAMGFFGLQSVAEAEAAVRRMLKSQGQPGKA